MISDNAVAASPITGIKERFKTFMETRNPFEVTLYDLIEPLGLHKFKELLSETGLLDFLKHPSKITVIAPIDEAFDSMTPWVEAQLNGKEKVIRRQTLARGHIITYSSLFHNPLLETTDSTAFHQGAFRPDFEANYDLNGNFPEIVALGTTRSVGTLRIDNYREDVLVHSINGVHPLEPSAKGSVKTSNGNIIFVPKLLIGKAFLEQKYREIGKNISTGDLTTWETLQAFGFTKFCKLVEIAGLVELLDKPVENKADKLKVLAPIDEAFEQIDEEREQLQHPTHAEKFVKSHIAGKMKISRHGTDTNLLGDELIFSPRHILFSLSSQWKTSNGSLLFNSETFWRKSSYYEKVKWSLQPIQLS